MFYCSTHNWYSGYYQCPACPKSTTSTNAESCINREEGFVWTDKKVEDFIWGNIGGHLGVSDIRNRMAKWVENQKSQSEKQEKVPEWEIVEMVHPKTKEKLVIDRDGAMAWEFARRIKNGVNTEWKIYSVKRLSDSEVFSVSEEVLSDCRNKIITGFEMSATTRNIEVKFSEEKIDYNWLYAIKKLPPKEDKPVLVEIKHYGGEFHHRDGQRKFHYLVSVHNNIMPIEKFPLVKRCIEYVLNNDAKGYWKLVDELLPGQLKFTQSDLNKAIQEAFAAGRETAGVYKIAVEALQYPKFEDYLKSKE